MQLWNLVCWLILLFVGIRIHIVIARVILARKKEAELKIRNRVGPGLLIPKYALDKSFT